VESQSTNPSQQGQAEVSESVESSDPLAAALSQNAARVSNQVQEGQVDLLFRTAVSLQERSERRSELAQRVGLVTLLAAGAVVGVSVALSSAEWFAGAAVLLIGGACGLGWLSRSSDHALEAARDTHDRLREIARTSWASAAIGESISRDPRLVFELLSGVTAGGPSLPRVAEKQFDDPDIRPSARNLPLPRRSGDAIRLPVREAKQLCIVVRGDLTVDDLIALCDAVQRMYSVLLAIEMSQRLGSRIRPDSLDLEVLFERAYALAPDSTLRVASARFASPGDINFEGSGEVVEKVGEVIERAYTRHEVKRAARLDNDARALEVQRAEMELDRDRELSRIEIRLARLRAAREAFILLYGPEILETDEGRKLFQDFLGGAAVLDELDMRGKLSLSETTVTQPTDDGE
jgi:hypothetical protein